MKYIKMIIGQKNNMLQFECERADGFPDNWTATMPERWRHFTMGNALVVPLIKDMGENLLKYFAK